MLLSVILGEEEYERYAVGVTVRVLSDARGNQDWVVLGAWQ